MLKKICEFFVDVCVTYCICILVIVAVSFAIEEILFGLLFAIVVLGEAAFRLAKHLKKRENR